MTPIEIFALVLIALSIIKIIVISAKPKTWADIVRKLWVNPMITGVIAFILAIVVFYYLIQEITIIQIFATFLFLALFAAVGISVYSKEMIALATKMLKDKNIVKKSWLYIILWIVLLAWGLKALFFA